MRVALVAESFPPYVNGVARTAARILDELGAEHEFLVIHPRSSEPSSPDLCLTPGPACTVPAVWVPPITALPVSVPTRRALNAIEKFRPDIIHLASPYALGGAVALWAKRKGIPTVAVYQTDITGYTQRYHLGWLRNASIAWTRALHNACGLTLVPSSAAHRHLAEIGVARLARWGRGVDTDLFSPEKRDESLRRRWLSSSSASIVVGYVGRLAAEKGLWRLKMIDQMPEVQLVIVGAGPAENDVRRDLPNAIFCGAQEGEDLARHYASFDVFVHPGEFETFCQTIQEAHASGVPVVAVDAGGPSDLVTAAVGALLPVTEFATAAPAVIRTIGAKDRREWADVCRTHVSHRGWDVVCAELPRFWAATQSAGDTLKRVSKATLEKNPRDVAAMFDGVGKKYDLTNTILSFGQDRRWRRLTRQRLGLKPGDRVLDLAAGTAVSTEELARSGAWCVACDFSRGMLAAGAHRKVPKVVGDGLRLPFADDTFDAVTISYGLRNLNDYRAGLRELARVTKPGGRITIAEFSTPTVPVFGHVYKEYLMRLLPAVARKVASNPEAYVYLAESIRAWPNQEELAQAMRECGWSECGWQNLTGGIVALHSGIKP